MAVIFVVSFAHQPLTLGLVYGDPAQRDAHRSLYRWAPWVALALIVVGLNVSLSLVAVMAGLWNAEHTLMQRYGVMRIYGRKVGDDQGRIEKPMLIIWLVAGIAYIGGVRRPAPTGQQAPCRRDQCQEHRRARRVVVGGPGAVLGRCCRWGRDRRSLVEGGAPPRLGGQPTEALVCARHGGPDHRGDGRPDRRCRRIRGRACDRVLRRRAHLPAQTQRRQRRWPQRLAPRVAG